MSRENVVKFYEEVNKNEKIRKEFENLKNKVEKGTKEESLAKEVVSIAKNNGFNFTEKELKSYTKELKGILREDELLSVSGGIDIKKIGLMGTMILACAAGTAAVSSSAMGQEVQQPTASASASVEASKSSRKMQNVKINKVEVTNPYSFSSKYKLRVTVDTKKSFSVTKDLIEKIAEKVEHGWISKSVGIDPSLIEEIEFVRADKGAVTLNKISKDMREKGIELRGNVTILGEDTYKKIKAEENVAEPAVSADYSQKEQAEEEEAQSRASVEKANEEVDKKEDFTRELNKVLGKWSPNVIKKDLARVQQLINEANNKVRDAKLERIPKLQQQIKSAQDAFGEAQSAVIEADKKIVDVKKQTIGFEEVRKAIENVNKAVEKAVNEAEKAAKKAQEEANYKAEIAAEKEKARIGEAKKEAEEAAKKTAEEAATAEAAAKKEAQAKKEAEQKAAAELARREAKEEKNKVELDKKAQKAKVEEEKRQKRQKLKKEEKEKRLRKQAKKAEERKKREDQSKEDKNAMKFRKGEKLAQKSHKIDTSFLDEDAPSWLNDADRKKMEEEFDREFWGEGEKAEELKRAFLKRIGSNESNDAIANEMGLPRTSRLFRIGEANTDYLRSNTVSGQGEEQSSDTGTVVVHKDSDKVEESGYDSGTRIIKGEQKTKNGEPEAERPRFEFKQVQIPMQKLNEDGKLYKTLKEMGVTEDEFKKSVEGFAGLLDGIRARALGDGSKQRPGLILRDLNGQTGVGPLLLGAPRIVNMLNTPNDSVIELIKEYIRNNPGDNIFTTLFGDGVVRIFERESDTIEDVKEQAQKLKNLSTFAKVFYKYLDLSDLEGSLDLSSLLPEVGANATEGTLRTSMRKSLRTSMKGEKGSPEILNNDKIRALREIVLGKAEKTERSEAAFEQLLKDIDGMGETTVAKTDADEDKGVASLTSSSQPAAQPARSAQVVVPYALDRESFKSDDIIGWTKGPEEYTLILCVEDESKIDKLRTSDDIINACIRFGINLQNYRMFKVKQGLLRNKETKECSTVGIKASRIAVGTKNLYETKEIIERQLPLIVNSCTYSEKEGKNHYHVYNGEVKDSIPTAIRTNSVAMRALVKGIYQRLGIDENETIYLKYDGEGGEWKEFGSNGKEVIEEAKGAAAQRNAEAERFAAEAAKREAEKKAAAEAAPLQVQESEKPIYMTGKKYDLDVSKLPNKFNGGTIKGAKIYLYHSDPRYTVFDFDDIYNACLIYGLDPTGCTSAVVQQGTYGGLNKTIPLNYEKMQKLSKVDAIRKQLPELVNACEYNSENHEGGRNYINYWIKEKEIPSTLERDKLFMKFLLEGIRERFDLNDEIDGVQLYFNNSWHSYNFIDYED